MHSDILNQVLFDRELVVNLKRILLILKAKRDQSREQNRFVLLLAEILKRKRRAQ